MLYECQHDGVRAKGRSQSQDEHRRQIPSKCFLKSLDARRQISVIRRNPQQSRSRWRGEQHIDLLMSSPMVYLFSSTFLY
ncbi:unnamed protein product [Pocillopora meandrina]|uniref:Uncharacterized protein n=1 Tax=Pocillopora meandrina TaxID=46732 RepID=A0AAU9XI54_9CNID|nr:unnamed protein product [Pocillopora meandrina]